MIAKNNSLMRYEALPWYLDYAIIHALVLTAIPLYNNTITMHLVP